MSETSTLYTPKDSRNLRVFNRWFFPALGCFLAATLLIGKEYLVPVPAAWALTALTIVLLAMSVRAYVLFLRQADELLRKVQLEAFAMSSGAAIVFMLGYRLCERLGAPKLDVNDPLFVMAIVFAVAEMLGNRRYGGGEQ